MEIVLLGRPNVGKSSLLNALLGSDRAIVTARPGTTRDLIAETVQIDGIPVVLTDTAGLRPEPDEIERLGIERTRQRAAQADGLLIVLDRSALLDAEDEAILADAGDCPAIVVANKSDLPPAWSPSDHVWPRGRPVLETSALTAQGLDGLRSAIRALAGAPEMDVHAPILTLARHRDALERAAEAVALASASARLGAPADLVAVDIQAAVEHIGGITGEVTSDEILDRIFAEFCIGK
jgi:tRNA modification GTPase